MSQPLGFESRASALRGAFDQSFAAPPPQATGEIENLLIIRVAEDPYAIRLHDIAGVVARRKIVPIPGGAPDLLGAATVREGIVPVFALAMLLGYPATGGTPTWMVLCRSPEAIAVGFAELEGYVQLPRSAIHLDDSLRPARQHVKEVARIHGGFRPVISLPLVVATIRNRAAFAGQQRSPEQ